MFCVCFVVMCVVVVVEVKKKFVGDFVESDFKG